MLTNRKAASGDIPFLFQCYNEEDVAEKASLIFEDDFMEFQHDYLEILSDPSFHVYILELKGADVGFIQVRETGKKVGEGDGSLWLGRKRCVGYGLNAFYLLLYIAFEELRFEKLWGWVRANNEPMNRICKRFGLRITDRCERPAWKKDREGHLETILYYEIDSQEYRLKKALLLKYGRIKVGAAYR